MIDPKVPLDLGDGRMLRFTIAKQGGPAIGAVEEHPDQRDPSNVCAGSLMFDTPEGRQFHGPYWQIVQEEPLTLSPSVLCTQCGNHGFIRDGKWIEA